ncbi:IgGFc-binding protein-like [Branchiostoma floridae]|uniref:IgGFc-binding protein-like n=1 Tax=Branchiostoma floridae TaxID=7739 RepID=A0A9J7KQQ2_BRAFL|nr:IgGFc-binding protein-like [Branchiostoma floridae]
MTRMVLSLVVLSTCICCLPAARDNKGTEFILTFPENVNRIQHNPKLFISCPHHSGATVTITTPSNGVSTTVQVTYGQVKQVELDRVAVELRGSVKSDKAVHVTSDVEIVVYGIFAERRSTDAFLALPTDVLGTEYFTPCTSVRGAMPAEFGVVGVHDGTTVTIVPSQPVTFDGQNYAAGQTFSVGLDRFETLQVQATEDLTGSEITADQPVAVLSGNMFASCKPIGQEQGGSGDHIVEMIPPVDTWGKEFVTVPLTKLTGGDLFRVVAARDNTLVAVTNEGTNTLNAGEFWEFDVPSDEYRHVTSSEPVLLVQYSKSKQSDSGDPFMMVIPPVAQFETEYTFATVELIYDQKETTHHVNLIIRSSNKAGLLLDGQRLPSDTVWHDVPGTDYVAAQLDISAGTHTARHLSPNVNIGLFSYGFTHTESYGYPGGLRLSRIAASCSTTTPVPADRVDNDCDGRVDEELLNGIDDDGDGLIDEDMAIGNCADNRDQYRTCLQNRCRNLVP